MDDNLPATTTRSATAEGREAATGIIDTVREPMLILDPALRVVRANRSFYRHFRVEAADTVGRVVYRLGNGQWDIPALRDLLENVLVRDASFDDYEVEHKFESIGRRVMRLNARRVDPMELILLAIEDVTEGRSAQRRLEEANERLEREVEQRITAFRVLHGITRAANEALSAEEAIAAALRGICEHNAWEVGHAWRLADDDSGDMVSTGVWHLPPGKEFLALRAVTAGVRVSRGQGFIGRVVAKGQPFHVADLLHFHEWHRGPATKLGVRAAVGFPVVVEGETVAVLEFFHSEPMYREPAFTEIMVDVGVQVGYAIERQHLEREIGSRTDQERQRLAQALHDSLGQQIAGLGMIATQLERHLSREGSPRSETAGKLVRGLEEAKLQIRALAKGLLPVVVEANGLMNALADLVEASRQGYPDLTIRFECDSPVELDDNFTATQLYRIAQEAFYNAVRHASAEHVTIRLAASDAIELEVRDDGNGIPDPLPRGAGSGLRIMRHRAGVIGGELFVESVSRRGTTIRCVAPRSRAPRRTTGPDDREIS